uniref:Uncharacterized protein n=1 Tax=Timema monikensis TaxID=170555 RepID=A0A7R9HR76_9NEOP|nr:unnamed protein product [Timema monikensis]
MLPPFTQYYFVPYIGEEDWEQSHEVLAGLSEEQNELEARLATLWQDEDNIPQEQGSEDSRPEVPVTTNPTKSPPKEFSVLDAFRRDGKFSLAHIPPPPLPAHTHKDAGRHLPMAFLPRQESPGIPFMTPTGRGMRLGRPDMVPPMMPPGMLPQNRGFVGSPSFPTLVPTGPRDNVWTALAWVAESVCVFQRGICCYLLHQRGSSTCLSLAAWTENMDWGSGLGFLPITRL